MVTSAGGQGGKRQVSTPWVGGCGEMDGAWWMGGGRIGMGDATLMGRESGGMKGAGLLGEGRGGMGEACLVEGGGDGIDGALPISS